MRQPIDAGRTGIRRVSLTKVDDSGTQQLVNLDGLVGDSPESIVYAGHHGFTSVPPKGSEGLILGLGGRSDKQHLLGLEHKDHRPKNLGDGNSAMYCAGSAIQKMLGDDITVDANGTYTITVKELVIKAGGVTMTINGDGVAIQGGKVTHGGHDIGQTHQHTQTQPGAGLSGIPQ